MLTAPGLRYLFQSLGTVTLSAASQAVLHSTCRRCRNVQQPLWHAGVPDSARAASGLVQTVGSPIMKVTKSSLLSPDQVQHPGSCCQYQGGHSLLVSCLAHSNFVALQPSKARVITTPEHLNSHIKMAREEAILTMRDRLLAAQALEAFVQQLTLWTRQHSDQLNSIVLSSALLSMAHVTAKAETFDSAATQNPLVRGTAAAMIKLFMQRVFEANNRSTCVIFWACARLQVSPDDVQPGFGDKLGQRFIETQTSAILHGVDSVLWACSTLGLNPQDGTLLEHLAQMVQQHLTACDFTSKDHMRSLGTIMASFTFFRLHVEPPLAELIITRFHQGLLLGATPDPQSLRLVLWACASLGYLPAPHMLHCFKDSYAASQKHSDPFLVQCDSSVVWSLAVLGVLDMDFFKMVILRCRRRLLRAAHVQQLHQALYALQPLTKNTPAYKEWSEVAKDVLLEWPSPELPSIRSPTEAYIFRVIQLMGFDAIAHHSSENGLHSIDIALLPQAKLPCKVAIEVDGVSHFLYESYKLDKGPIPTKPDGKSLFRNAVLEKQGWRVVVVPWFEWKDLPSFTARLAYLEQKIGDIVLQHALDARLQH
ncbi:TPA: hypothetical protein ACH3X2_007246 [Trebouxia sp. C0005]